jgi:GNAT superfamily N-acetyltransferase
MTVQVIRITDDDGAIVAHDWLVRAEGVYRELRPHIPQDYVDKMHRIFAGGGRMIVAIDGERVVGVALYRIFEDTFNGKKLYCDDLVTTEAQRSTGVGHALMQFMEREGRVHHCNTFALDSGVQRNRAHAFYYREGMYIVSFNFKKDLNQ